MGASGGPHLPTFDDVVAGLMGQQLQERPAYLKRRSMAEGSSNTSDGNSIGIRPKIFIYNLSATWRNHSEAYSSVFKGPYGMEIVSCGSSCMHAAALA